MTDNRMMYAILSVYGGEPAYVVRIVRETESSILGWTVEAGGAVSDWQGYDRKPPRERYGWRSELKGTPGSFAKKRVLARVERTASEAHEILTKMVAAWCADVPQELSDGHYSAVEARRAADKALLEKKAELEREMVERLRAINDAARDTRLAVDQAYEAIKQHRKQAALAVLSEAARDETAPLAR